MKDYKVGDVTKLFISKKNIKDRLVQSEIIVDTKGVFFDKFYNKNIDRSVLITSIKSYKIAQDKEIQLTYGDLGENILVDFSLDLLHIGDRLKIDDVILEITQHCTICDHLANIDKTLPMLLAKDRGIFAKVIKGGTIKTQDIIHQYQPNEKV